MARPKLAIDRCWVEKELKPYLRCTFSHALRYDADIGPQIESAIDFCMYKPDYPTDAGGYDLIFERICLAIDRRDLDYAPDLALVTEHLEPLAKFLIRWAQLKGPYTLLGRMNIGSGAWREYQAKRLDDQRGAEDDKAHRLVAVPVASKPAPIAEQIDPRLINAQPGQHASSNVQDMLTVAEDYYYRQQNRLLDEYQQRHNHIAHISGRQQLQNATAVSNLQERTWFHIPSRGWTYSQPSMYGSPLEQPKAPAYVQDIGRRQGTVTRHPGLRYVEQYNVTHGGHKGTLGASCAFYAPCGPGESIYGGPVLPTAAPLLHMPILPHSQQQLNALETLQEVAVNVPRTTPVPTYMIRNDKPSLTHSNAQPSATVPMADFVHLGGINWSDAAAQRNREFKVLTKREKAEKLLQLQHTQPLLSEEWGAVPLENSHLLDQHSSLLPSSELGNMSTRVAFQPVPQQPPQHPAQPAQKIGVGMVSGQKYFTNHPGFSNVKSSFPNLQYDVVGTQQFHQNKGRH